jgi:NAD(P)H-nitrite reductase
MALPNGRLKSGNPFEPQTGDDLIICRCEEITKGEIRQAIYDGMRTMTEIRRYLRAGMGLCQGQTCARLVKAILVKELAESSANLEPAMSRAPARPVEMRIFGNERRDFSPNA